MHFWTLLGLFFFNDSLPRKQQALIPLFIFLRCFFLARLCSRTCLAGKVDRGDGSGPSSSTRPPFDLNMPPEEEEPARSFDLNRPGDEPGPSPEEELLYLKEEKLRLKQAFQQAIQDFERLREAIDQSQESNPQSASALGEKLSGLGQKFKDLERMQERLCQLESDCYKTVRDSLEKELKNRYI